VLLNVVGRRVAVDGVGFDVAVRAELLEIELVPERAGSLGAIFPEEKRADDAVAGRETDPGFDPTVTVRGAGLDLGARYCQRQGGNGGRGQKAQRRHSNPSHPVSPSQWGAPGM
jgi:hypothetical protein